MDSQGAKRGVGGPTEHSNAWVQVRAEEAWAAIMALAERKGWS